MTAFSLLLEYLIIKLVAKAVAKVFTRLLPNNKVPISFSFFDFKKLTIFALEFFFFSSWCILCFDTAVSAVSDPEKKPDNKIRKKN